MIKGIYGLNIAVADLDTASAKYEKVLGVPGKFIGAEKFAFPGLKGTNFNVDGFHLNLIASTQPDTSIAKFIEKKGEGVFLVSLEVGDLDQAQIGSAHVCTPVTNAQIVCSLLLV